jgi:polyhydroxybutyrate depolymerase
MSRLYLQQFVLIMLSVTLLLACRAPARQPASATALTPGDTTRTLVHDGHERSYVVHVPPGYDPAQPVPLVLIFHGGGGNAENVQEMTGFNATADAEGFIVAYPNGSGRLKEKLLTWNGGTCCGYAIEQDIDDVGFVKAMIEDLATIANVDRRRIYATGMSNGAIMSYRLACELSDVIAAIGPVAATQNVERCEPERPVPVIHFHGDSDQHAPYNGGVGSESLAGANFASVEATISFWVKHNGCASEPQVETSGSIVHTVYTACEQNADVELYTILGGLHAWPGGQPGWRRGDAPTQALPATGRMWAFFEAHPQPLK